jgi:hypothetical protein
LSQKEPGEQIVTDSVKLPYIESYFGLRLKEGETGVAHENDGDDSPNEFEGEFDLALPSQNVLAEPKQPRIKGEFPDMAKLDEARGLPTKWQKLLKVHDQEGWTEEKAKLCFGQGLLYPEMKKQLDPLKFFEELLWHPGYTDQRFNDCVIHAFNMFVGGPLFVSRDQWN